VLSIKIVFKAVIFFYMDINNITLPNGKTLKESDVLAKANQEDLYTETFAKGHYIIYFDQGCPVGHAIRANSDGSEDLLNHDEVHNQILVKRLAEKGNGKYAYLCPG
jgi:hypothetical protein